MITYTINVPSGEHSITFGDDSDVEFACEMFSTAILTKSDIEYIVSNDLEMREMITTSS
jgi:hypothetical protein